LFFFLLIAKIQGSTIYKAIARAGEEAIQRSAVFALQQSYDEIECRLADKDEIVQNK
jgi:hypothetical protein